MSALAAAAAPDTALRICRVDDVPPGEGRAITVDGRRIAVFNTPTGWYALDDACPHRGGPLSDGLLADRCVICPLHDRRFDLQTGAPLSDGDGAKSYGIVVRGTEVLLQL